MSTLLWQEFNSHLTTFSQSSTSIFTSISAVAALVKKLEVDIKSIKRREDALATREAALEKERQELHNRSRDLKVLEEKVKYKQHELDLRESEWQEHMHKVEANKRSTGNKVTLNVGGKLFCTSKDTLMKHEGSYFEYALSSDMEYFIDRDPKYFNTILNFMRGNKVPQDANMDELEEEFNYYGLPFNNVTQPRKQQHSTIQLFDSHSSAFIPDSLQRTITSWLPNKQFKLIFKATRDGFESSDFHRLVDRKGPTLTIIQSSEGYLFGGYTSSLWDNPRNISFKSDLDSFIFTLSNPHFVPATKFHLLSSSRSFSSSQDIHSICCEYSLGPVFGSSKWLYDIIVLNNSNKANTSYFSFPAAYEDTIGKGYTLFTGNQCFATKEILVCSVMPFS